MISNDPAVHRELVVVDPPMEGRDVANLQRAVHDRLKVRGLADEVYTPTHGQFTHASWLACVEAGYFLGLLSTTYLATVGQRGVSSEGAQTILRNPDQRTAEQLQRAKERRGQADRGPRYYDDLAHKSRVVGTNRGAYAALTFARKEIGTTESPAGSNWGGHVKLWIELAGYSGPVPWCGCFANACVVAGGLPSGAGWIGYTPAIIQHARRGIGGWSWHEVGQPGDLALFDTPGGDIAVHVGVVEHPVAAGQYQTIEGNTSSGVGGSQDNGGGVFRRQRTTSGNFRIVGFARPPWTP